MHSFIIYLGRWFTARMHEIVKIDIWGKTSFTYLAVSMEMTGAVHNLLKYLGKLLFNLFSYYFVEKKTQTKQNKLLLASNNNNKKQGDEWKIGKGKEI